MTADEIYDEVKKNGIPVGLDAWMTKEIAESSWRTYLSKMADEHLLWSPSKTILTETALREKEQKEKEALELAKMYFR